MAWVALTGLLLSFVVTGPPVAPQGRRFSRPPRLVQGDIERLEVTADVDLPQATFLSIGLAVPGVVDSLSAANVTVPNALQRAAFPIIASGRDAVLHACTGSGKTLSFLLPLLQQLDPSCKQPQALVLSPSRELAFQTMRVATALLEGSPLRVGAVAGGANPTRQIEKIRQVRPQLLIGTAGRVGELAFEWKKLNLKRVRHLVVDEVDEALRSSNLGATKTVIDSMQDGRPLQMIFASATADNPMVRRTAVQLLREPVIVRLLQRDSEGSSTGTSTGSATAELPPTIRHTVYVLPQQKHLQAVHQLVHSTPAPTAFIFVNSPHRVKIVCEKLKSSYGIAAEPLYGKQEREQRVNVMRKLMDGRVRFVVTTEMGARGLDIPQLTHVVNLELPTDHEHYVHRAGRTGRAGATGTVISIVSKEKEFIIEKLTKKLGVDLEAVSFHAGMLKSGSRPAATARRRRGSGRTPRVSGP